jgi:PhzF family phenazine biosynthesis protein
MRLAYHLVNVFTRDGHALSGNPLCVVEAPEPLPDALMQELALQFNLSETTFIGPSAQASARVRIFTPGYEMPFAGHPTLGTAHIVRRLQGGDRLTLEMHAGVIPVEASGDHWTLTAIEPQYRRAEQASATVAAAIGLEARDLTDPVLWVNAGTEQLVVPLASTSALERAQPDAGLLRTITNAAGVSQALVFVMRDATVAQARFFFRSGAGFLEDPATGSACANLGGWMLATGRPLPLGLTMLQGDAVRRPSTLRLSVEANRRIRVGGDVRYLGSGVLEF